MAGVAHTPTPTLVRLATNDASSPLGPSDAHARAHAPLPSAPMERQRQHTTPSPIVPPLGNAGPDVRASHDKRPSSPLGPSGTHASAHAPPPSSPVVRQRQHGGAAPPAGVSQLPPSSNPVADGGTVAASPVPATRKREGRGSHNHVTKDELGRQRRAALLLTLQANTGGGT